MKNRSFAVVGVAILAAGLLLTGCSGPGNAGIKAMERAATANDSVPEEVKLTDMDLDKVLLVAEADGKQYFLGQDHQRRKTCLVAVTTDSHSWHAGCTEATLGEMLRISGPDRKSAVLVADGFDTAQLETSGLTKIHENILVVQN